MSNQEKHFYEFGPFRLDPLKRRLLRDGELMPLTPKAFDTLLVLVQQNGKTIEKDDLMKKVWPGAVVEENNLNQSITALRKSLGDSRRESQYIATIPGLGYRFVADVREVDVGDDNVIFVEKQTGTRIVADEESTKGSAKTEDGTAPDSGVRQIEDARMEMSAVEPPITDTPSEQKQETDSQLSHTGNAASQGKRSSLRLPLLIMGVALIGAGIVTLYRWAFPPSTPTPIRALAVLPFKPLAAHDQDESLELGMADTLIARLSSVREIVVRPVTAVRKYGGLEQDPLAAGRELGVEAVLDGSLQRAGERIRVRVRLLSVADGRQLWVGRFDEAFTDIFAVQDAISERVAASLAPRLSSNERERLTKHYTEDTEAYQEYVRGRYHWNKRTREGFEQAIKHFQRAVEIDAAYALAYAGLADCYNLLGGYLLLPPKESYPSGKAAAVKALDIDESLSEAHTALGFVKARYEWDWDGAETEFRRAIELNHGYAIAHSWYGLFSLVAAGRVDEAIREAQQAEQLDPVSIGISVNVGWVFYFSRQYDQAIAQSRKLLEMDQSFNQAYANLGMSFVQKGMYAEAIAVCEEGLRHRPDDLDLLGTLGFSQAVSGRREEAHKVIDRVQKVAERRYIPPTIWARVYIGLSEKDRAFEWLEKGYEERDDKLIFLNSDPVWDSLRTDPRFASLLQRIDRQSKPERSGVRAPALTASSTMAPTANYPARGGA